MLQVRPLVRAHTWAVVWSPVWVHMRGNWSMFLSLPSPLSKKVNKHILEWGFFKKHLIFASLSWVYQVKEEEREPYLGRTWLPLNAGRRQRGHESLWKCNFLLVYKWLTTAINYVKVQVTTPFGTTVRWCLVLGLMITEFTRTGWQQTACAGFWHDYWEGTAALWHFPSTPFPAAARQYSGRHAWKGEQAALERMPNWVRK